MGDNSIFSDFSNIWSSVHLKIPPWGQKYVLSWPVYKLYFRLVWWGKCFCSSCKYKAMLSHARVVFLLYLWFCWQYCDFVCFLCALIALLCSFAFYALLLLCCVRLLFMRSYCFVVLVCFLCALIALLCSFSFYALLLLCCAHLLISAFI